MEERQVQYEFKVIVRAGENAWPHEILDGITFLLTEHDEGQGTLLHVEQIEDYS